MDTPATTVIDLAAGARAPVAAPPAAPSVSGTRDTRYLFGPVADFFCLGGSSLLLLPFLFMLPEARFAGPVTALMMLLANVINHPHFAHSYQIFYRGFAAKAFTPALGREMQVRYLVAGVIAPVLLAAFLAYGALSADPRLLGYGANLMVLAVGWHYAKQGYGMLMVDAALKRNFLDARAKRILLVNCYVVWLASWVNLNVAISKDDLWGLAYYSFALPQPLQIATTLAAIATSAATVWALAMHSRRKGALPVNGVVAYGVSLYLWLLFVNVNPLWGFVVPALHSVQYLVVVWRFQLNYERAQLASEDYRKGSLIRSLFGANPAAHLGVFVVMGVLLGFLGFWGVPIAADGIVPYDKQAIPGALFPFMFWIFLNVHHYVLDSVMWRSGNPETKAYLFG